MTKELIESVESKAIPVYQSFDKNLYPGHILPVRSFSTMLAKKLKAQV